MIDLRHLTSLDWPTWAAARAGSESTTPPTPILVGEALRSSFMLDVVDGHHYLADTEIPFCFNADEKPPARVVDLTARKTEATARLQSDIRAVVDAAYPPQAREALSALLTKTMLLAMSGVPVDVGVALVLGAALTWCENAMIAGADIAARVAACTTLAEIEAVTADADKLGPAPAVTAGELATTLRASLAAGPVS